MDSAELPIIPNRYLCPFAGPRIRLETCLSCGPDKGKLAEIIRCDHPEKAGAEVSAERWWAGQKATDICRFCKLRPRDEDEADDDERLMSVGFRERPDSRQRLRDEALAQVALVPLNLPLSEEELRIWQAHRTYADNTGEAWTLPAITRDSFREYAQALDSFLMPRAHLRKRMPEEGIWKLRALMLLERLTRDQREARGLSYEEWRTRLGYQVARGETHRTRRPPAATIRALTALCYACCPNGSQELDCPTLRCERRTLCLANGVRPCWSSQRGT